MPKALATASSDSAPPLLAARGLVKEYPGVRALDGVDVDVRPAEILGLVGENGAGKSTLLKILGGVIPWGSYRGQVLLDGQNCRFGSIASARRAGVAVVHQELVLVPDMSVADNLVLGAEASQFGLVDRLRAVAVARDMLSDVLGPLAADIDPEAPVGSLGVGLQQLVEITRALASRSDRDVAGRLIVLDEPTAALTDEESERLFQVVCARQQRGTAFVYVSHRIDEVFALCDRVLVLRDGRTAGEVDLRGPDAYATGDTEAVSCRVIELMTGSEVEEKRLVAAEAPGAAALEVEDLRLQPAGQGPPALDGVSLSVRKGEIVAVAGAMGSGRTALLSTLFGAGRGSVTGLMRTAYLDRVPESPAAAMAAGMALVPEDRKRHGLVLGQSVSHNMVLPGLRGALVENDALDHRALDMGQRLKLRAPGLGADVATLSGGNQQKIAIGKWLLTEPDLLLLDEPTRGVDVGARAEIHRLIRALADEGRAVLLASSDLNEVLVLADRIIVLREGRSVGELAAEDASQQAILAMALGAGAAPKPSRRDS